MTELSPRDRIRSTTLATRARKRKEIEFFGEKIEIMQPTLGDIIGAQESEDRQAAVIDILTKYAVIPGTTETIYEEGDADAFKEMPFGKDFIAVSEALTELTDVNFLDKKVTSKNTEKNT